MIPQYKINSIHQLSARFLELRRVDEVRLLTQTGTEQFIRMVSEPEYLTYSITKRSGGIRTIDAPAEELKRVQRVIADHLNAVYCNYRPACAHGFAPALNDRYCSPLLSNAAPHIGKQYVLNMDIEDFFGSVKASMVRDMFMQQPFYFPEQLARTIALITCYKGRLPQGAPTSPVISNLIMRHADRDLTLLANEYSLDFTRYADDLTFSGLILPQDDIPEKVNTILSTYGFRLNGKKIRKRWMSARQEVTGIIVNEKLNVSRKYIRRVRAILHDWDRNGIENAKNNFRYATELTHEDFKTVIGGKISFIGMVRGRNDAIYLRLKEKHEMLDVFERMK